MTQPITRSRVAPVPGKASARVLLWGVGLVLSALVGLVVYMIAARTVEDDARGRFAVAARGAQHGIKEQIADYSNLVRALSGMLSNSQQPPSRLMFHRLVASLEVPRRYPALEAVTWAPQVRDGERAAFVESVRTDRSLDPAGYPGFDIRPRGRRPDYTVLTWFEPMAGMEAMMGYDMASRTAQRDALEGARDSGAIGASGTPVLVPRPTPHYGMGMRMPVYRYGEPLTDVAARRAAYLGSVGIGFSVPALVRGALAGVAAGQLALSLYSARAGATQQPDRVGPGDRLLFGNLNAEPAPHYELFETVLPIDFNGNLWKARFRVRKSDMYRRFDLFFPRAMLVAGMGGTWLLYAFCLNMYWSRRTAVEQRALLESLLDSVDAHVYMKDRERRYLYVNARTAEAMNRKPGQIIGKLDREVLPPALADTYWEQDRDMFEHPQRRASQTEFPQPNGQQRQFWTVKVPVIRDGEVTAIIGMSTDVTELHNLKQQADAANAAKSNFLSNMSHEIRTPMNSIIGMSHLALKSVTDARQRDYLEKIFHSGQHLMGIIDDILDFSKIEAGKLELEVLDFGLDTLMHNIGNQLGNAAAIKGLRLRFDVGPGLAHQLRGDPLRLEQVLLNFTSNAIKFSENGVIHIRARLVDRSDSDTVVRFEVEDNGIGMSDAEIGELFTSFHQADPSTTRKYGGTGLGLVISKQLAELMGGCVGVDSVIGRGSTFWFTARLAEGESFRRPGQEEPVQAWLDEIRGARILLVEDNVFSQQVGQELLEEAGAHVVIANNGKEAIDLMHKARFDCVLMDLQMPVMDGFETTRMIRNDPRLRDALVIAMTANAGVDDQARCLEAGMDQFVTKPIAPNLLFKVIATWLRQAARRHGRRRSLTDAEQAQARRAALQAPVSNDPLMLDLAALAATFGNDAAKMRKYALLFLDSAGAGLAEIGAALERGDVAAAADLGHRIKSSARAVGATGFADLCQQLEGMRGSSGSLEQSRAVLSRMHSLLERLKQHIPLELAASSPS